MKEKIRFISYCPHTSFANGFDDLKPTDVMKMSLSNKTDNLKQIIKCSYEELVNKVKVDVNNELIIFMAPEWYFKNNKLTDEDVIDHDCDYTLEDMKATFLDLKKEFAGYKSLLIIPGTFYYHVYRDERPCILNCSAAIYCGKICSVIHKFGNAGDIRYGWDHKDLFWLMWIEIEKERIDEPGYLYNLGCENSKWWHDKNFENVFESEIDIAGEFICDKTKLSLEICVDHRNGRMKQHLDGRKVDIQLVTSAAAELRKESATVGHGGLMLLCDGFWNCFEIARFYSGDNGGLVKTIAKNYQSKPVENVSWYNVKDGIIKKNKENEYVTDTDVMIYDTSIEIMPAVKLKDSLKNVIEITVDL